MASENVENLARAFEAFERGDMQTVAQFIDPEFVIEDRILIEGSPTERGTEALIANTDRVREVFGDVTWRPREVLDLGDRILVRVHIEGTGRHTALQLEEDSGHIFTLRNGRAIKLVIFRKWEEARAAAGLED